jgi:AraC family transcriptional activator of pyochelin receptor
MTGSDERRIEAIIISPEMTTLIGTGHLDSVSTPDQAALMVFAFGSLGSPATIRIAAHASAEPLGDAAEGASTISFVIAHAALRRLFDWSAASQDGARYHLPSDLRMIALALRDCPMRGETRATYRASKSVELLCEAVQLLATEALVPVAVDGILSLSDSRRLVDARRIIDERWSEKLTLDGLARACGINRAKLTRGFRELYRCSVAEALAERRLAEASRRLLTTDLPVSKIGYESGYLNNASFARAFGRRFGVSPSEYRGRRLAA